MKKLLLPIVLFAVGTGGGIGAGVLLKPESTADLPPNADLVETAPCGPGDQAVQDNGPDVEPITQLAATEYVEFSQQFVVPIVEADRIAAMMVLTLGIEVPGGEIDLVFKDEPRLRDSMLQDMFTHANIGGFSGNFTEAGKMRILRQDLLRSARDVLGETALDVLILDLVRQDI